MVKKIFSSELFKGSLTFFVLFNIFNVLNFVFQVSMARMLGPEDFGVLATLMLFMYFLAIPADGIQLVATKYASRFYSNKENGKIKFFLGEFFRMGTKWSFIVFIFLIPVFFVLSNLLKINFFLFLLVGTTIFSVFLVPSVRGVMQGMKKFNSLGMSFIFEGATRIIIAVFLVFFGWKVYGAVIGIILSTFLPFIIAFIPLKEMSHSEKKETDVSKIYKQSPTILYVLLIIMFFQSIDIFLVRLFFVNTSEAIVGQYAVANQIGKMIFFGTLAISRVMFPISSEKFASKGQTKSIVMKSLGIVALLCIGSLFVLAIFPKLVLGILYGGDYLAVSNIIFNIGLAFSFLSLANLVLLYAVSIDKKIKLWHGLIFVIVQTGLLYFFRGSLYQFSIGMILSGFFLFIGSWIIFMFNFKERKITQK